MASPQSAERAGGWDRLSAALNARGLAGARTRKGLERWKHVRGKTATRATRLSWDPLVRDLPTMGEIETQEHKLVLLMATRRCLALSCASHTLPYDPEPINCRTWKKYARASATMLMVNMCNWQLCTPCLRNEQPRTCANHEWDDVAMTHLKYGVLWHASIAKCMGT